jgi:hypothetical protein
MSTPKEYSFKIRVTAMNKEEAKSIVISMLNYESKCGNLIELVV